MHESPIMPLDELYPDVFHTMLDFLNLNDIARLSSMNRSIHEMCTEYVLMVSELTLDTLQHRHCRHRIRMTSVHSPLGFIMITPEQCTTVDKFSVEHGYCRKHLDDHICEDCWTIREVLEKDWACADNGCCYKYVCSVEDGGCSPIQCWSCLSFHDVISMYKFKGEEKDRLCEECVQEHEVADVFVPCVTWYGLSLEEADRRYGSFR